MAGLLQSPVLNNNSNFRGIPFAHAHYNLAGIWRAFGREQQLVLAIARLPVVLVPSVILSSSAAAVRCHCSRFRLQSLLKRMSRTRHQLPPAESLESGAILRGKKALAVGEDEGASPSKRGRFQGQLFDS